ncbi:ATPase, T2SS/T4P/T4SS family [Aminipila sp.]|uniref:ATPase, T2SS/T4P/T4SS family n=1 Tax=Aminipila sp. TaxID=2060095 RepID=UPI00289F6BB7|nr:ATPase, T2SS/T4P/T4SS family [Aminipila sp.]
MSEFDIIKYTENKRKGLETILKEGNLESFKELCDKVRKILDEREGLEAVKDEALRRHNKALLGNKAEVSYYINKIQQILEEKRLSAGWFPDWYKNLAEAIYHEGYGFAGFANWMDDDGNFIESSTCKIIGERIYNDVEGVLQLQKQTIDRERFEKLRTTLLNADPKKLKSEAYHEIYSLDGKRITIYYDSGMTKANQPTIVFRRYLNNVSSFEAQAARHTIPEEAILLFMQMVKCGFNTAFIGPVKSAKTTFLTVWQSYEDPTMEGLQIETDPEIPLHLIMPKAPIMQLVPTGKYMKQVITTAKRSDAQYVVLGEARDGEMMNIAVEAANMGTRHSKVTLHTSETIDFSFDVADKITRACGGDLGCNMIKVAKSFHYIFNFFSLPRDRKQKRLKGIWEMRYDNEQMRITMHQICRYRILEDDWVWSYDIGKDKTEIGTEENYEAYQIFEKELKKLSEALPDNEKHVCDPAFLKMWRKL